MDSKSMAIKHMYVCMYLHIEAAEQLAFQKSNRTLSLNQQN